MRSVVLLALFICLQLSTADLPNQPAEEVVLQFVLEPGKIECLYQPITDPKYHHIELDYQVTEGGELDIDFLVKNPQNVQIVYDTRKKEGNHRIPIATNGVGDYTFCFSNAFSMQTKKNVFFELFLLDKDGNFLNNYDTINNRDLLTPIMDFERITTKVKNNLNRVEQLLTQIRTTESRDRSIMESNFERVNFWSVVHLLCIVSILAIQLFMVRSLFEDSKVGRVLRKGRLND